MSGQAFNSLLHRLFLTTLEKNQPKFKLSFEYIMENRSFAPKEQMLSFFHNIFKHMIFQRCQKGVSWSKGLR